MINLKIIHVSKRDADFPKLMIGKNSGIIYLVTDALSENLYRSISLTSGHGDAVVGVILTLSRDVLSDFEGTLELQNA